MAEGQLDPMSTTPISSTLNTSEQIEVDTYLNDHDSAYGDEISTYTASISSDLFDFPEVHGRRYHAYRKGRYALPNDEQESKRLEVYHALMCACMDDRLFFAPIGPTPQRVIDIGTGTGIWAIDFADDFPSAEVIGNDLSPTQPTSVPPNLQFYVDDIEDQWLYEDNPFDFVHGRFLIGCIRDWPKLVRQAYTCTRPGGWAEFLDWDTFAYSTDGTLAPDSALTKFHTICVRAREAEGYDMKSGRSLGKWLRQAGFVNVTTHKIKVPLGLWPKNIQQKKIGAYNLLQMQMGIEAICLGTLPHAPQPWSIEEIQVFIAQIRDDLRNPKIHAQYDCYVVYGQKPAINQ